MFLVIFCLAILGWLAWLHYSSPLAAIPGPFAARFTSLWKYYVVRESEMPWVNAELHKRYGEVVRLGPSHVSADSIEAVQKIYIDGKGFPKSDMYSLLQPFWEDKPLHNIFSTQDVAYHTLLQRKLGHLYSMSSIAEMEPKIDVVLKMFLDRLAGLSDQGKDTVDMSAWLQYYTFDAQGQINFSTPMGFIERGEDVNGFCHLDHAMMTYFAQWGQIPQIEQAWSKAKAFFLPKPPMNPLYEFVLGRIMDRFEHPKPDVDFLNATIALQDKHSDLLSRREVIAAIYINIVTGHDVTAIQLRAIVYHVSRTPHVYKRLRQEIDDAVSGKKLPSPARYSEICDLPYLAAVIQETLRIHPSAGLILERLVPAGGMSLGGKFIPGGTTVGVNAWAINRNAIIFGNDVETFRPERWLEASQEKLKTMRKAMFTFGAGARGCIGKNMAMLQLYKVTFELFRTFDVEWPTPEKSWKVAGAWLTRQTEMEMRLSWRRDDTDEKNM